MNMSSSSTPRTEKKLNACLTYNEAADKFSGFQMDAPLSLCYKITQKCNLRCPYCIAASSPQSDYGLETGAVKDLFNKLQAAGVMRLDITGGEPFIRGDILELLAHSVACGLETVVTTNGFYMTDEIAGELKRLNVFTQVSLDGPASVMDKIRGPGAFEAAWGAIKKLKNAGAPVRINSVLQNIYGDTVDSTMESVIALAKEAGITGVYFIIVCAQGRASKGRNKICFAPEKESQIRLKIQAARGQHGIDIKMLDFKQYTRSCVLIDTRGDFISQGWSEEDCINTGNLFKQDIQALWKKPGNFDHALHLLQYIRHPLLYK